MHVGLKDSWMINDGNLKYEEWVHIIYYELKKWSKKLGILDVIMQTITCKRWGFAKSSCFVGFYMFHSPSVLFYSLTNHFLPKYANFIYTFWQTHPFAHFF